MVTQIFSGILLLFILFRLCKYTLLCRFACFSFFFDSIDISSVFIRANSCISFYFLDEALYKNSVVLSFYFTFRICKNKIKFS